ncbi:MAG: dihydroneopterin aldolase [Bacillota bacterium]
MDKIIMKNMVFFGYHGLLQEENILGQRFCVDIEMSLDLRKVGTTDCVNDTVSYAEVYEMVKNIVSQRRFRLIEALAETLAADVLKEFTLIEEILVRIRKPEAPVNGVFDYFGVEIRRKRSD